MVVCFVGVPLSGKSTIAKAFCDKNNWTYFGTGDFARSLGEMSSQSIKKLDLSLEFNQRINDAVKNVIMNADNVVIDGFPRSMQQINILLEFDVNIKIIYVYIDPFIMNERMEIRQRDVLDTHEIVLARCTRALDLKQMIMAHFAINDIKVIDGENKVSDSVREIEKWLEK